MGNVIKNLVKLYRHCLDYCCFCMDYTHLQLQ